MAMNIHKLNGDTTFLISFFDSASDKQQSTGRFTILIDPWLQGQSSWLHPSFQFSQHTIPPVVDSLAQIADQVDLIVISQDKPDHCHRQTLCSWPRDKQVRILAAPAAARKIRDWKHFPSESVYDLSAYNSATSNSLFKYRLSAQSSDTQSAELTIANLASKKDLTGLHNAIALTYCPPARCNISINRHDSLNVGGHANPPQQTQSADHVSQHSAEKKGLRSRLRSYRSLRNLNQQHQRQQLVTPPQTPDNRGCLSCLYSPHGVSQSLLEPYIQAHLIPARALPLDVLIHSTIKEQNPWYMGGVVAAGTPGGVNIIRTLDGQVKTWISAHDERKDNRGVSVALLKTHHYAEHEINAILKQTGFHQVSLMSLDPGQEVTLGL